jgi:predicted MFS family arabinose efflux permease
VLASFGGLFGQRLFLTRGLIGFFLFASFGTLWSGLSLPLADVPWRLGERTSSVIGGYMVFYSLGSALGAATTTVLFTAAGWVGSSILGAVFAACSMAVWASLPRRRGPACAPSRCGEVRTS